VVACAREERSDLLDRVGDVAIGVSRTPEEDSVAVPGELHAGPRAYAVAGLDPGQVVVRHLIPRDGQAGTGLDVCSCLSWTVATSKETGCHRTFAGTVDVTTDTLLEAARAEQS
jgi:hypothetical protein